MKQPRCSAKTAGGQQCLQGGSWQCETHGWLCGTHSIYSGPHRLCKACGAVCTLYWKRDRYWLPEGEPALMESGVRASDALFE